MAVVATPIFAQAGRHAAAAISIANTNRDGSGTIGTVFTADATDGSGLIRIDICATGTTTAGVVRLFIHNGSSYFLWREILVGAITPSASVAAFQRRINLDPDLPLAAGWSLRASTHNAETFNVHCWGYDF
jgi:hypothetical protein